jgi:alpha-D-xyloside xylohydrolase
MKHFLTNSKLPLAILFAFILTSSASAQVFLQTSSGIKTRLQNMEMEVHFFSPKIVRVLKYPVGVKLNKESLSVNKIPEKTNFTVVQQREEVLLKSSALEVRVNLATGKVSYSDLNGNVLFTEKENGASFSPTVDVEKQTFTVKQAFVLDKNESLYGLGQQQNGKLNQRGQQIVLKNENTKVCIPFFQSIKGYGVFWDNYASTLFTDNEQETSFESLADCSDYYFMYGGSIEGVVVQMRDLTGQAPMQPLWAFGYLQSKERYKNQKELIAVVEKYRQLNVPLDGIVQDWQYWGKDSVWNRMGFNSETYPDPQGMVDQIHQLNAHLMIVAWPGFGPKTKQYAEFMEKKMLIKFDTWPLNSGTTLYDPYNPEARKIYWDYLNKGVFTYGPDAWWLDSSEPDHFNIKESDFDQPTYLGSYRSVVNAYPLQHIRGVYENQRATTSDKRVCILTRSAFAGQQRYGANTWSGDIISSWETLQKQIPAALNFTLVGNPYWNADIGGFFLWEFSGSNPLKNSVYRELYARWIQFGAFTPMMRSHGTDAPREIYQFGQKGDRIYDAIDRTINLRYRLLPYIYSTAWQVTSNSGSIMRALVMDYADDTCTHNLNDEYLFGQSILVAPVVNPMYATKNDQTGIENYSLVKTKSVYLPKGTDWFDFWTGKKFNGGQRIEKDAPIDIIPLFVKAGSILPIGPKVQYAQEKKWENLEIRIYPGSNGTFTLYEDENDGYNYEKGAFTTITFSWKDKRKELTIKNRKGNYTGMLESRKFNLVLVGENAGIGDVNTEKVMSVSYSGKQKTIKF